MNTFEINENENNENQIHVSDELDVFIEFCKIVDVSVVSREEAKQILNEKENPNKKNNKPLQVNSLSFLF